MADPAPAPPPSPARIFAPVRRRAARQRMGQLQKLPGAPRYVIEDMVADLLDRIGFLQLTPRRALIIGDWTQALCLSLSATGIAVVSADPAPFAGEHAIDEEQPLPGELSNSQGFDLIASLGHLDTVNDLPGALIHLRQALAPGGLMIASFVGAGSLMQLREAMRLADAERPAPRLHPMVDVRAGGQLLQRAGFADGVCDSHALTVRFRSFDALVADLRAQGLSNVLARPGPSLSQARRKLAQDAFGSSVTEKFEIMTLSGWNR